VLKKYYVTSTKECYVVKMGIRGGWGTKPSMAIYCPSLLSLIKLTFAEGGHWKSPEEEKKETFFSVQSYHIH
jgi:hypothetical protein